MKMTRGILYTRIREDGKNRINSKQYTSVVTTGQKKKTAKWLGSYNNV